MFINNIKNSKLLIWYVLQILPGNVPRPVVKKNSSQSSFDWNFSAPSSPTLPKVVIEAAEFEDDDDEGITFNFDQKDIKESADVLKDKLTRDLVGSPNSNEKSTPIQEYVGVDNNNVKKR